MFERRLANPARGESGLKWALRLLHLLPHDLPRLYFRIVNRLVGEDHTFAVESEGPDLSGADVILRHRDFRQVHENVPLGINFVSPAIREEAVISRHFLLVRWFEAVFPGGTIRIHQLRAHMAISAVNQKSLPVRSQRRIKGFPSILQRPLRRNNLPSPNEPLLYFRNARLRLSGIAEQARHE